ATSTREAFTTTRTNEASATPPQLATARAGGKSWRATPRSPHGSPPNGHRARSASGTTHAAAMNHGDRRPARFRHPTRYPLRAVKAAHPATSGTMATIPKYQSQYIRIPANTTPNTNPYNAARAGVAPRHAQLRGRSETVVR